MNQHILLPSAGTNRQAGGEQQDWTWIEAPRSPRSEGHQPDPAHGRGPPVAEVIVSPASPQVTPSCHQPFALRIEPPRDLGRFGRLCWRLSVRQPRKQENFR